MSDKKQASAAPALPGKAPLSPEERAKLVAEAREKQARRDKARALWAEIEAAHKESEEAVAFYTRQEARRRQLKDKAAEAFRLCEEAFLLEEEAPQGALGLLLSAYKEARPKGKLA